ncbi:MAG: peptidase M48, partial [Acidovorax sp.]
MNISSALRLGLAKVFGYSLLSLFLIPLAAYLFTGYAQRDEDTQFLARIGQRIDAEKAMPAAEKQAQKDFYRANPPSTICTNRSPELQDYREAVCEQYGELWQFNLVRKASLWTLVAGALLLASVLGLGALAFVDRKMQYTSFVTGWHLTTWASAAALVVQGALAVWLSFWVTAFFFHKYSPKLIIFVGIAVAIGVLMAIKSIFTRVQLDNGVDGELVAEADAPILWKRIRHMAGAFWASCSLICNAGELSAVCHA